MARIRPRAITPGSTRGRRSRTSPGSSRSPDALAAGGYHPFHAPCGILLDEANRPASQCIRCAWCDGYPCLVHAKADADVIAVRPLLDRPNVTLLVNAEVERLGTDPAGRTVTEVEVSRDGSHEVYTGDIVVVAAGAANSARILLRSASGPAPGRAGQRLRPGGPQLHVPQQQGRGGARQGDATTRYSRRRSP